jgi:hypothetical protein
MKKFILIFFLLLVSCYKGYETNPYHPTEYLGNWINEPIPVIIEGIPIGYWNFSIMQSEVRIYDGEHQIYEYKNWKVDKTTNPPILYLEDSTNISVPNMSFSIIQEPINSSGNYVMILESDKIYQLQK